VGNEGFLAHYYACVVFETYLPIGSLAMKCRQMAWKDWMDLVFEGLVVPQRGNSDQMGLRRDLYSSRRFEMFM